MTERVATNMLAPGVVVAAGGFDNIRSPDVRFLQEAARLGPVHVRLWSDALARSATGRAPMFAQAERRFVVAALRYVERVSVVGSPRSMLRPLGGRRPGVLAVRPGDELPGLTARCDRLGVERFELDTARASEFPLPESATAAPAARRVVVTGCFDWLHSGHVQFFHEAAALGELYVVVGSDRNVRYLKGDGHPLHTQDERRYMVQAVRAVHRGLISSGRGWMDAEPEIASIEPHLYVVNEDGDQPEKREFCRAHGLEYVVLQRRPHPGLPRRTSTDLRGF